ncbi:hypothetical protein [Haladaptatus salinisoli]|uniref:hypothetical protein n=1 Tax=Haladaptatus salinisoli TaxID=2884876 RepID=UPI001D0BBD09|nr:hypothetical protein [Haladaptatus salinisoli]
MSEGKYSRRAFLAGVGGVFGTALASKATVAQEQAQKRTTRQMLVPKSQPFAGNYVGQFVIVADAKKKQVSPDVVSNCQFPNWKPKNTRAYDATLVDRLSDSPQSVRTEIFMNGTKRMIRTGQPFIIGNAVSCSNEYVGLEAQSVPPFAADGESMGPTVPGTNEGSDETTNQSGQSGFGALAAAAGIGGGGLLRAIRSE